MYLNCFLGSEFNNAIMKELFQLTGIKHKPTSLYHPQGNCKQFPQNILNIKCHTDIINYIFIMTFNVIGK